MSSTPPVGASVVSQAQYSAATNATALMECLCQLQEQGGYQQMASAILSGNLDRALRTYKLLQVRAPRKPEAADPSSDTGDALEQLFDAVGVAIAAGDEATAKTALASLQHAVAHAHAHHTHGKAATRRAVLDHPSAETQPVAGKPDEPTGHIDIRV
ncbi:MAG: hypothetical protein JO142_17460 [Burkholderiales bacterium]|nr:hypothetical protein [Burkholderiales bacterium]